MMTQKKRFLSMLLAIPVLLAIPLLAMQITTEVNWKLCDFIVMGGLLAGITLLCELILRKVKKTKHRLLLCVCALFGFFLIWAELAVGIFGSPFAGN